MGGENTDQARPLVVERLIHIIEDTVDGLTVPSRPSSRDSITRLELDSVAMLGFLVAVEDEFEIEWDVDVDPQVLRSFDAMAEYLVQKRGLGGVANPSM